MFFFHGILMFCHTAILTLTPLVSLILVARIFDCCYYWFFSRPVNMQFPCSFQWHNVVVSEMCVSFLISLCHSFCSVSSVDSPWIKVTSWHHKATYAEAWLTSGIGSHLVFCDFLNLKLTSCIYHSNVITIPTVFLQ